MAVIPEGVRARYPLRNDVDATLFTDLFQAPEGAKILVVGAHDEPTANMLADSGFDVLGIDLREYDPKLPPCNYRYVRGDFCSLPHPLDTLFGHFDCIVSLSAVEHFGMGTYGEGRMHAYYDIIALHLMGLLLKPGGQLYLTVPMGGHYVEVWPHWRVYNLATLRDRLVQDFEVRSLIAVTAGECMIDGRKKKIGEGVTPEELSKFDGIPPHVSSLLVMAKGAARRRAPDGR